MAGLRNTDEYILEHACETRRCRNWRADGYVVCISCLHGNPHRMSQEDAERKLQLDMIATLEERDKQNGKKTKD